VFAALPAFNLAPSDFGGNTFRNRHQYFPKSTGFDSGSAPQVPQDDWSFAAASRATVIDNHIATISTVVWRSAGEACGFLTGGPHGQKISSQSTNRHRHADRAQHHHHYADRHSAKGALAPQQDKIPMRNLPASLLGPTESSRRVCFVLHQDGAGGGLIMRHTAQDHAQRMQHLDRINRVVAEALREMCANHASLHLEFAPKGPRWVLSNRLHLLDAVARAVIRDRHVVAVDRGLFRDGPNQTWRWLWCDLPEDKE
jgi:hypothetical protein